MKKQKNSSPKETAIVRVVQAIRKDCIALEEGVLIGSEDELLERYQTSRPTLRHAAAIAAQEQLLTIKRGVGGGYFATKPESGAVAHMAAMYLQTRNFSPRELVAAFKPVRVELARLTAINRKKRRHNRLLEFLNKDEAIDDKSMDYRTFVRAERQFGNLLSELCENTMLSLFFNILLDLASMIETKNDLFQGRPKRVEQYRSQRNKLIRAMLDADEQVSVLEAQRLSDLSMGWMLQDMAKEK